MMRSAFQIATIVLAGSALSLLVILIGFFASPNAVRTSPPSAYDTLLLNQFQQR